MVDAIDDPLKAFSEIYQPDPRQSNMVGDLSDNHAVLSQIALRDQVPANVRHGLYTDFIRSRRLSRSRHWKWL
jgi:hypothetical protein